MSLKRSSELGGGSTFFKPEVFKDAVAILVEPTLVRRDVPNEYKGQTKSRDEVTADLTVFHTDADLASGSAVEHKDMVFTHPGITNRLSHHIGESIVGSVGKKQFPKSAAPAWVIDPDDKAETTEGKAVTDEQYALVEAYYEARESAVASAAASAPGFDD